MEYSYRRNVLDERVWSLKFDAACKLDLRTRSIGRTHSWLVLTITYQYRKGENRNTVRRSTTPSIVITTSTGYHRSWSEGIWSQIPSREEKYSAIYHPFIMAFLFLFIWSTFCVVVLSYPIRGCFRLALLSIKSANIYAIVYLCLTALCDHNCFYYFIVPGTRYLYVQL